MTKNQVSRRTVLKTLLVSAGLTLSSCASLFPTHEEFIKMVLRRKLSFLKLDADGLEKFAEDYAKRNAKGRLKVVEKNIAFRLNRAIGLPKSWYGPLQWTEDFICTLFLMSSDFFIHNADEEQTVHYLGIYDPYERPCSNPFAVLG